MIGHDHEGATTTGVMIGHDHEIVTTSVIAVSHATDLTFPTTTQSEDDRKMAVCDQPPAVGSCTMRLPRYYYDAEQEDCLIFNFSGCDVRQ